MHTEGLLLSSLNCVGQQIIKCRGALQFVTRAYAGGWMGWLQGLKCNFQVLGTVKHPGPHGKIYGPLVILQWAPYIFNHHYFDKRQIDQLFKKHQLRSHEKKTSFWPVNERFHGKRRSLRAGNAGWQKQRAWEWCSHAFPLTLTPGWLGMLWMLVFHMRS